MKQFCAVCAWRENCAKKFSVPDGGARCPDFTRDISLRDDKCRVTVDSRARAEDREKQ